MIVSLIFLNLYFSSHSIARLIRGGFQRGVSPDSEWLYSIATEVEKNWDVPGELPLRDKALELIQRLRQKGIEDLTLFNAHPRTWAKLFRNTVLKDSRTQEGDLIKELQERYDDLLKIMYADDFKDVIDKITLKEVRDVIEYFYNDAGWKRFSELPDSDLETLMDALKKNLAFEGWLWLRMAIEPPIWIRFKEEYEEEKISAQHYQQYYKNLLQQMGKEEVEVYMEERWIDIGKIVPTHHVDIEEEGKASYEARSRELEHGIMIPVEVAQYTPGGKYYLADGHARVYSAYKLGLKKIRAYVVSFSQPRKDWEEEAKVSSLFHELQRVADIPSKKVSLDEILKAVKEMKLPDGIEIGKFSKTYARAGSGLPIVGEIDWQDKKILVTATIIKNKLGYVYILTNKEIPEYLPSKEDVVLKAETNNIPAVKRGNVKLIFTREELSEIIKDEIDIRGKILVVPTLWDNLYLILDKGISGIICEEGSIYHDIVKSATDLGIPVLFQAKDSTKLLKDGMPIYINGMEGEVSVVRYRYIYGSEDRGYFIKKPIIPPGKPKRIKREDFFPEYASSKLEKIWQKNMVKDKPTLIAIAGFPLAGATYIVDKLKNIAQDLSGSYEVINLDNYKLAEDDKPIETEIALSKIDEEVHIPYTEIYIKKTPEGRLRVRILNDKKYVSIPDVHEEVKVDGYEVYISQPEEGKLTVRIPEPLARYELHRLFKDVLDLKSGKEVYVPLYDFRKKKRIKISEEELNELLNSNPEEISFRGHNLIPYDKKPQGLINGYIINNYKDLYVDIDNGEILAKIIPEGKIIFIKGLEVLQNYQINKIYDWKIFVDALRPRKRENAMINHILEDAYPEMTLKQVMVKFDQDMELQETLIARQKEFAQDIIDNNKPFPEEDYASRYGPAEKRIKKALEVYERERKMDKSINPYDGLTYVSICFSPLSNFRNAIEYILKYHFDPSSLRKAIDNRLGPIDDLNEEEFRLLNYVLEELKLI